MKATIHCIVGTLVDDMLHLRTVLESASEHIHSSAQLFKLAQDAFKTGTAPDLPRHYALLNASLELGLQVRFIYHMVHSKTAIHLLYPDLQLSSWATWLFFVCKVHIKINHAK